MKILVIRFSSLADIVLATPIVRILKTQLDEVVVHFATELQYKNIMENNPYIDTIYYLDKNLATLMKELKIEKYDCVIDLQNSFDTRIIKWKLGVASYSIPNLRLEKWLMVKLKINKLSSRHQMDLYLETLQSLNVKNDALGLDYFIPEKDEVPLEWIPETHRNGYVAFAIDAQYNTKKLPVQRLIELCDKINKPVILLGDTEDFEIGEAVRIFFDRSKQTDGYEEGLNKLGKDTIIFNSCGLFNLNQSASLVKQANYVFAYETGLMQIAAAFRKEVFSLWGNTIPAFGFYPYRTKFTVLENSNLSCRPCSSTGYNKCPKGHFKCMNEIVFDFYVK